MNQSVLHRVAAVVGAESCEQLDPVRVRAMPLSTEATAALLGLCYDEGWRVACEGAGSWQPGDAPAQILISPRALDGVIDVRPAELSATVQAGVAIDELRREALEHGCWLPLDPPGHPGRSIGSVVATGTVGPLRQLLGPMHDQLLDLTVVTGDGKVISGRSDSSPESRATDLIRMHAGGFGGFGVITECRVRLHALPRADASWMCTGDRDRLTSAARTISERELDPAVIELLSPALANDREWVLAARFVGNREEVDLAGRRLGEIPGLTWQTLSADRQQLLWNGSARAMTSLPITLRLGALAEGLDDTLDVLVSRLGESLLSAGGATGAIRWCGHADARALRLLRSTFASREVPLTLERAPWNILRSVGHFGAYRESGAGSVSRLRERFDPKGVLVAALGSEESE